MKKTFGIMGVTGIVGALLLGGCASQEVAKTDEGISPASAVQTTQSNKTPAKINADANNSSLKQAESAKKQGMSALETIYFDFDSSAFSGQARNILTKNTDYLRNNQTAKLLIEGNCDERGSAEYNIALGEKRAKAAMKYLVTMGIQEGRLETISYGKERPADQGHDEAAWAKNRRDEFKIR